MKLNLQMVANAWQTNFNLREALRNVILKKLLRYSIQIEIFLTNLKQNQVQQSCVKSIETMIFSRISRNLNYL